jgi:hypothetical protein
VKLIVRIEVTDDMRRAINHRHGKPGKATREDAERLSRGLLLADLDQVYDDWYRAEEQERDDGR